MPFAWVAVLAAAMLLLPSMRRTARFDESRMRFAAHGRTRQRLHQCNSCNSLAMVAAAADAANWYTGCAHALYTAWAIDTGRGERDRRACRARDLAGNRGPMHSGTTLRPRPPVATIGARPPRRGMGSRLCRTGLLIRARSRQRTGGTSSPGRCARRVKNIHCKVVQLLQALVHQRWTMLLMLMLACAELFVLELLLLQLRKAWVITVSSTYHHHTVCTRAVCTCAGTHACRQ